MRPLIHVLACMHQHTVLCCGRPIVASARIADWQSAERFLTAALFCSLDDDMALYADTEAFRPAAGLCTIESPTADLH
jgi:hypothetical protein